MPLTRDDLAQIRRFIEPLLNRIANSSARVTVQVVNDGTMQQLLQVGALEGEDIDDAEHFHPYGFASHPLEGAEGVAIFPNGDRGHPLIVAVADRRHRPVGSEPGEVVVYNHTGATIRITATGDIVMTPAPGRSVLLGSAGAADAVAMKSDLQDLADALAAGIAGVVSGDGGVAALTAIQTYLTTTLFPPFPRAAGKVKVE